MSAAWAAVRRWSALALATGGVLAFAHPWGGEVGAAPPGAERSVCPGARIVDEHLYCDALAARVRCPGVEAAPGTRVDAHCRPLADPELMRRLAVPVDPERADALALTSLPGVGPVIAGRIIAARPLGGTAALLAVRGIGEKTLARMQPRLSWSVPPADAAGP